MHPKDLVVTISVSPLSLPGIPPARTKAVIETDTLESIKTDFDSGAAALRGMELIPKVGTVVHVNSKHFNKPGDLWYSFLIPDDQELSEDPLVYLEIL